MRRHEIVIVGGGPAGLSTALHLVAQRPDLAEQIVVLERARYPREKFCAGALSARAELDLGSIGVVVDVPAVLVSTIVAEMPNGVVARSAGCTGRVVRRIEFDAALAGHARRRGVRIVEDAQVKSVVRDGAGVSITSTQGGFRARVVVGGVVGVGVVRGGALEAPQPAAIVARSRGRRSRRMPGQTREDPPSSPRFVGDLQIQGLRERRVEGAAALHRFCRTL